MAVKPNSLKFLSSLSSELTARAERVRHLIGDKHWGHDGSLKESVLADALRPHVEPMLTISKGFIVNPLDMGCSREQDLMFCDAAMEPPVFSSRDTVIAAPGSVAATVSVKTQLRKKELADAIDCVVSAKKVCNSSSSRMPFGAVFFFEEPTVDNKYVEKWMLAANEEHGIDLLPELLVSSGGFSVRLMPSEKAMCIRRIPPQLGVAILASSLRTVASRVSVTQFGELLDGILSGYQSDATVVTLTSGSRAAR